jgi:hypothetical protein
MWCKVDSWSRIARGRSGWRSDGKGKTLDVGK